MVATSLLCSSITNNNTVDSTDIVKFVLFGKGVAEMLPFFFVYMSKML